MTENSAPVPQTRVAQREPVPRDGTRWIIEKQFVRPWRVVIARVFHGGWIGVTNRVPTNCAPEPGVKTRPGA